MLHDAIFSFSISNYIFYVRHWNTKTATTNNNNNNNDRNFLICYFTLEY